MMWLLYECSCIIEFIQRVGGKDKIRGFAKLIIHLPTQVSIYNMT